MEASKTKIIFMGTSLFAKEILTGLTEEGYGLAAIVTQPDKKTGREQKIKASPIKEVATMHNIPVFQPEKLDEKMASEIRGINPDFIVVAAYGKILPEKFLGIPKYGCINVHASLLPKYRGPSPIQNALIKGENETGITLIKMDAGIDTGDILSQKSIGVETDDTGATLSQKLSILGKELIIETIPLILEGKVSPQKQNEEEATFCQLIEREDGHIFWNEESEVIYNKYRALCPWPGVFTFWKEAEKMQRLKLCRITNADADEIEKYQIGEVFELNGRIGIQTAKGLIILEEIQLEGKSPIAPQEFIKGHPEFIGSILT
jgi:methionyl-tRNA formyltransferase